MGLKSLVYFQLNRGCEKLKPQSQAYKFFLSALLRLNLIIKGSYRGLWASGCWVPVDFGILGACEP